MGMHYARHDGEAEDVAVALNEQYQPRFAGDDLPSNPVALSLIHICTYCIFLFEELPSFIIPFYFASERTLVNYLNSSVK